MVYSNPKTATLAEITEQMSSTANSLSTHIATDNVYVIIFLQQNKDVITNK